MWDEIINAADSLSTNVSVNVICTVAINVANTASTNFDNRNVEQILIYNFITINLQ